MSDPGNIINIRSRLISILRNNQLRDEHLALSQQIHSTRLSSPLLAQLRDPYCSNQRYPQDLCCPLIQLYSLSEADVFRVEPQD